MMARGVSSHSVLGVHQLQRSVGNRAMQRLLPSGTAAIAPMPSGSPGPVVQRACGADQIGQPSGCTHSDDRVERPRYLFEVNCDEFRRGNEEDLRRDAEAIQDGEIVDIHGFASIEGDPDFNRHLSCARSLRAKAVIEAVLARRGVSATLRPFDHGGTSGDPTLQRSVVVTRTAPTPPPEPEEPDTVCGPDATDWLTRQVAAAKRDPIVLRIKRLLEGAERVARSGGFSARDIAEGAVAKKVLAEEARVGSPARTAEARSQFAASVPGQKAFGRALVAATVPIFGRREALVLAAIRAAALEWKALVGTGMRYDFKNDARTMQSPTSDHCPVDCKSTITLCPSVARNCFETDVPGNLFYAHVGGFVGWSELALQLGSQFAELESAGTWDSPEDTRMITLGFALPDPLASADLCSAINSNRSVFNVHDCANCAEVTTAEVV
jgi:hypothetical protein